MIEFEGNVIQLGNPEVKIKNLMRSVNAKDNEIRELKSLLEETKILLAQAEERISKLHGSLIMKGKKPVKKKTKKVETKVKKKDKAKGVRKKGVDENPVSPPISTEGENYAEFNEDNTIVSG